jgi:DNA polymerase-3 subunit delta
MIMYIYGEDTFRSREYLQEAKVKFKKQRDPAGYNTVELDGKNCELSKIVAEMKTAPFLGEKRMVVVENILSSSDEDLLVELTKKIENSEIPESTILVFWQADKIGKAKAAKNLQEILAKEKYSQNLEKLVGVKLVAWIEQRVKERGAKIEKMAVQKLVEGGEDTWSLAAKIDQLVAFAGENEIKAADVDEFVEKKLDDNIFNLTDAVVSGNHKKALLLLEQQRQLGEDDGKLFGTILWQFRIMLEVGDLIDREGNITSDEIAKKLGIHPFVAKKNLALARQYSLARLEAIYGQLLETDLKTKTGKGSQSLLLDLFAAKV